MKIIVTYASAGGGHFRAAQAIFNALKIRNPGAEIKLVDCLDKSNLFFKFSYRWGYSFLVNDAIFIWKSAFWLTYTRRLRPISRFIASCLNRFNTYGFWAYLKKENPDCVVSTHFLTSEIAASLKRSGQIKSTVATIITDFGVHPFWITDGTDMYIVASSFTKDQLIREGVSDCRIKEFGIPVDTKFLQERSKELSCRKLGLDPRKFTVIIMTGTFGLGPIEEVVDILQSDMQILAVCSQNNKLYRRIEKKNLPNVKVFSFVNNLAKLMAASDLIITKPGGLTIAEVITVGIVPVFIAAIPGQETTNAEALASYGIGTSPKSLKELKEVVLEYKAHPEKIGLIKEKIIRIQKPQALGAICDAICQSSTGASC